MKVAVDTAHQFGKRIAIHSYGPDGARDAVRLTRDVSDCHEVGDGCGRDLQGCADRSSTDRHHRRRPAPTLEGLDMHSLAEIGNGQILWDILWLFTFIIWFWLLITVFGDIFRDHDLGGLGKTLWIIFVIVLPYLGVFIYLIARGKGMAERNMAAMANAQQAQADYIKSVAGSGGGASEELARLADLRDKGVLSDEEFQAAKAKVLA